MKVYLPKTDLKELEELLETKYTNISVSNMFLELLGNREAISAEEIMQNVLDEEISPIEAYRNLILDYFELDHKNIDNVSLIEESLQQIDFGSFINNPYYQTYKNINVKKGPYNLTMDQYDPYELFPLNEIKVSGDKYKEVLSIAFSNSSYPFLALNKDNITWMSVNPNEINTMEKSINEAKGDVLIYGLGLGYYAFMVSLKPDVKSVTVIEYDQAIIDLFNENLLGKFPNKEKLTIIKADALNYVPTQKFDYAFIDLWHNPNDGLPLYINLVKKEYTKTSYWLETSILALLRRYVLLIIEENLQGYRDNDYIKAKTVEDKIINEIYRLNKNTTIRSIGDVSRLISEDALKNLAKQIKL